VARLVAQLILGNNHVARCDFVWRQPRLKRHLPGRLPDNADGSAFLRSYVVELVPESHRLITDRLSTAYRLRVMATLLRDYSRCGGRLCPLDVIVPGQFADAGGGSQ
jgi:hypothetical protein